MLSVQKLLSTLNEIKEISQLELALFQPNGKVVVETAALGDEIEQVVAQFLEAELSEECYQDYQLYKIHIESETEYVLVTRGTVDNGFVIGKMAASQIRTLILSKSEEFDRNVFIQNVLLGNMLTIDMFSKAKKLHIEAKPRVTYVIDTGNKNTDLVMELVKNLSNLKAGDFVTTVDEHSVVLVKDVSNFESHIIGNNVEMEEELEGIAMSLVDSLHMEAMVKVRVGYGNVVTQIQDIAQSFQEAKMALQVGKVFYAEKDTISYGKLGIGRLIYQLPMSLCNMFIKEVFGDKIPDVLEDEEAMSTIGKFFENNLNISETARQLYVHRNTLVYRLERIEKEIGLDIRKFDDAMTFRIAVMVLAHVKDTDNSK
ncbi:MAG: helix-turn-helix domain-containing protein [Agathobacter sp.]|nr:helix-turn-helix domain-containing protein [Agathobacter sp.]